MTPLLLVTLKLCVSAMIFAIGLGSTVADLAFLVRRPALLLRSLLAMYVAVPLLALLMARLLPLPQGLALALLVLAISAGAPLLPRKLMGFGGDGYPFSLVVVTSLLAIVTVPLWLAILAALFDREASLDLLAVAQVIFVSFLLPLGVGMLLRRWLAQRADAVSGRLLAIVGVVFSACALLLLALHLPLLASVGWVAYPVLAALTGGALLIGHLLGGPDPRHRTALAVSCATRHVGIAALVAAAVPGPRTLVLFLVYLVASALVTLPYLRWRRRAAGPALDQAAPAN